MEPFSLSVQHHELLDVFLQTFSFVQKAEDHVEQSSGKKDRRRTYGVNIDTGMFGFN